MQARTHVMSAKVSGIQGVHLQLCQTSGCWVGLSKKKNIYILTYARMLTYVDLRTCILYTSLSRPTNAQHTGRFIMFSVITNIYNKKTKGPTLMELFTATGKPKKFFWQLEVFDVCTTGDTAHIDTIFKLLPHTSGTSFIKLVTISF